MVTQANLEQYSQEGYTICRELLSMSELDEMTVYVDRYVEEQVRQGKRPEHLDKPHYYDENLLKVCSNSTILDAVEQFIGPNIVLFASHIICKAKGDGLAVPWHQDGIFWPLEPMEVITVWLAIDDSTIENGCMCVIPNTHNLGPIEHIEVEHPETKVLHLTLPSECVDESKSVPCEIPRGGCSFHAPYLIHGSTPNTSQKRRCGYTMRFMPTETRMLREGPLSKWFANHPLYLVRGKDERGTNTYVNV